MTALAALKAAGGELGGKVKASPVGLRIAEGVTFEEWAWIGSRLGNLVNASTWWVADWAALGFRKYGALANEAAEKFGLSADTLSDYRAVAEAFELPRRHGNLSLAHHREVAYLRAEQQDAWLARAERESLSRNALRDALRASRELPPNGRTTVALEQIRFTVPPDRAERWRQAADRSGAAFSEWAASALDAAAA